MPDAEAVQIAINFYRCNTAGRCPMTLRPGTTFKHRPECVWLRYAGCLVVSEVRAICALPSPEHPRLCSPTLVERYDRRHCEVCQLRPRGHAHSQGTPDKIAILANERADVLLASR